MIKEFSNHIRLQPVRQEVTDAVDVTSLGPFTLEVQPESDDNGTFWNVQHAIPVETPDGVALRLFRTMTSCIVYVFDHTGQSYQIGTEDIPARAVLSRNLNSASLTIEAEMIANPIG